MRERGKKTLTTSGVWPDNCKHGFAMKLDVQERETNNFGESGGLMMSDDG